MSEAKPVLRTAKTRKPIRILLIVNFIMLFWLVGPGTSHKLRLAEKRLGIANIIVHTFQFWTVASTVLLITLFVRVLLSRSEISRAQRPTKLDWILFLIWVFAVTILCLFAFMMGMGG
jgi:hypothetical protein